MRKNRKCRFISRCCICGKVYKIRIVKANSPEDQISHGYCGECFKIEMKKIEIQGHRK
jgi:hypothetical protein